MSIYYKKINKISENQIANETKFEGGGVAPKKTAAFLLNNASCFKAPLNSNFELLFLWLQKQNQKEKKFFKKYKRFSSSFFAKTLLLIVLSN